MPASDTAKRPFLTGHCFKLVFIVFVIASLLGTWWEELLYLVMHHEFVSRAGTVIGPFSPIYGFGGIVFLIFLGPGHEKRSILKTWLYSCLIGGVAEFVMSLIAEYVFGQIIWDYSKLPLNILGRTTIPIMMGWGLGGLVLMKVIYPWLIRLFSRVPYRIGQPVYIILLVFMIVNLFLTYGSMGRQTFRAAGNPPATIVGEFFDAVFTDEWLAERFPAISFTQ